MAAKSRLGSAMIVAIVALVAPSCGRKSGAGGSAELDKHTELRAKVKKKLETIAALSAKAKGAPQADGTSKAQTLKPEQYFIAAGAYLADPHAKVEVKDDAPRFVSNALALCGYATDGQIPPKDEDERYLKQCDNWQYVAVMRTLKWKLPIVDLDDKSFDPGIYVGDLVLIEIDSGEIVGVYPIAATNRETVGRDVRQGESPEETKKEWLSMARAQLSVAIEGEQKKVLERKP